MKARRRRRVHRRRGAKKKGGKQSYTELRFVNRKFVSNDISAVYYLLPRERRLRSRIGPVILRGTAREPAESAEHNFFHLVSSRRFSSGPFLLFFRLPSGSRALSCLSLSLLPNERGREREQERASARAHLFQARPSKFNDRCERTRVSPLISDSFYVDRCVSDLSRLGAAEKHIGRASEMKSVKNDRPLHFRQKIRASCVCIFIRSFNIGCLFFCVVGTVSSILVLIVQNSIQRRKMFQMLFTNFQIIKITRLSKITKLLVKNLNRIHSFYSGLQLWTKTFKFVQLNKSSFASRVILLIILSISQIPRTLIIAGHYQREPSARQSKKKKKESRISRIKARQEKPHEKLCERNGDKCCEESRVHDGSR